ncbi:glycoside hydrolase N-terminal domain-containing protein [Naasia sp. SYSU D00057]|uniref:glycosyl hydrolase family 95 catalytic domain-containing protein n=1 Tax=Naasia sp. SYSU D00057 TaxID=2817380 RepID=UPI001B317446|nr:glycoside hydrolase N-terminal domain-containing protein [Naasia sp. SYSU D00057]
MTDISFSTPARTWLEALPLGNGSLGAMCWGDPREARFDLNDESAWSGSPGSEARQPTVDAEHARRLLADARGAALEGRAVEAERAIREMQSDYTQAYLPLGTLVVMTGGDEPDADYERRLRLRTAVHEVRSGGRTARSVVSARYGVLLTVLEGTPAPEVRLTTPLRTVAEETSPDSLVLRLLLPSDVPPSHEPDFPAASWSDRAGDAVQAVVAVKVQPLGGDSWAVWATSETTFSGLGQPLGDPHRLQEIAIGRLEDAISAGADAVLDEHRADWAERMDRVRLQLDGASLDLADPPRRIAAASMDPTGPVRADPGLFTALFDYGRYLLLASSRPGGLPATLQGIWNAEMQPPWSSNYTLNINLSMAYWPAFVANLAETAEPLHAFLAALARAGAPTARRLYDADGWVAHHNSDAWVYTSPVGVRRGDASWAFWPMAGPWLVRHLREAVEYGAMDEAVAREVAWPVARGAVLFALDWMIRMPDASWGTAPSTSPENTFRDEEGRAVAITAASALDLQLLRDLFESAPVIAAAAGAAGDPLLAVAARALRDLPTGPALSADGRILEWGADVPEVDPQHRHLSPLYALYPGDAQFDAAQTAAAEELLRRRGDDSTGWSLAWKTALWARLRRGDRVADLLRLVIRPAGAASGPYAGGLYPNLFAAHPPFQLDGNLGFVAAVAESLLQSHAGEIDLLPALPTELPPGRVAGLVARPGVRVDLVWDATGLREARLRALARHAEGQVVLRLGDTRIRRVVLSAADTVVTPADFAEADDSAAGADAAVANRLAQ